MTSEQSIRPARFHLLGGRPSLDLPATRVPSHAGAVDRLRSPEDLERWFAAAGLVSVPVAADAADLQSARELRRVLYRLYRATAARRPADPADVATVNGWAARPAPAPRLGLDAEGMPVAAVDAPTAASLLALVARDAVEVLGGPLRDRVRRCDGEGCTLMFIDTSRGGRRRWCSMNLCGARSKMAAYRRRLQG
jgi:predicted RNA-binding Zn ribbon-like protein